MSFIATFCLVHGFSALLPPIPEEEVDYYEIMGLPPNASQEDIRKAYKKISLQLHPDKVAQRRDSNPEQARAQYVKVQEAHAILSNPKKRRKYDLLQKSPTRYQFVSTGLNPGAMHDNLRKASCWDKSRLVFLAACASCLFLLQPILICAKVNQDLAQQGVLYNTTWMVVLIPWWIFYGMVVIVHLIVAIITKQVLWAVSFFEHVSWFIACLFMALRWDGTILWDYKVVFIPVYIALALRWMHQMIHLRLIANNLRRMVTLQHLEREILDGKSLQDLSSAEVDYIHQQYVVVHVPPSSSHLEEEEERVQASPEYEHAIDLYIKLVNRLIASVVVSTTFVALVVAKVDGAISVSWWVVFVPLWVSLGVQMVASLYTCCCMPSIGDEFVGGGANVDLNEVEEAKENDEEFKECTPDPSFQSVEGSIRLQTSKNGEETNATSASSATHEAAAPLDSAAPSTPLQASNDNTASNSSANASDEIKEEMKQQDLMEDIPTTPASNDEWSGIHIDDDMYQEFQSAYQEAEESAMEAQAKSQANCCAAVFQLLMLCLLVGKLQLDYMSPEGSNSYNAFWILFPVFLIFGCVLCTCACLIYTAGESEGLDHLVERATHKEEENEGDEESPAANDDGVTNTTAAAASNDKPLEVAKEKEELVEQDSEIHDLD